MKTNQLLLMLLLSFMASVSGQDFKQRFTESFNSKDTTAQLTVLKEWEKSANNDADFYISFFNYYANKAAKEVISIETSTEDEEAMVLSDSLNNPVGFITSRVIFNNADLTKALEYINNGITKFPDRLDMRFGKTYLLGKAENYTDFTKEVITTLNHADKIKYKWKWSDNNMLDNPKDFMLSSVQGYVIQLYNTGNDDLLENMKQISEKVLEYHPEHIESMTNLSIVHIINEDYNNALDWLKKAEKLAPEDFIVLGNIALCYKMLGDTEKAIKYYELEVKYGDDDAKDFANEQLKELKKQ